MKLQKTNKEQYTLTIPKQIVNAKGWSSGKLLGVKIDSKGRIFLSE